MKAVLRGVGTAASSVSGQILGGFGGAQAVCLRVSRLRIEILVPSEQSIATLSMTERIR